MAAGVNRLINPNAERIPQTGELLRYDVDGSKIIHCFDPPHVLKSLRNNLLTKKLKHSVTSYYEPDDEIHEDNNDTKVFAHWGDVRDFYEFDKGNRPRLVRKISKLHIDPESDKMKVSLASQIFSKSLGTMMLFCSEHKLIPNDSSSTAYLLLFFNNMFDTINCGGKPVAGTFRGSITDSNKFKYYEFWNYAISKLEKMEYIDPDTGNTNNRTTVIQKTISTLKGYMELTKICLSLGMKEVSLRRMNQDGLENFFGSVRAVCHNSKSPIASHFRPGYTNLILTNLTSQHSIYSNCEEDGDRSLLKNVCELYDDLNTFMTDSIDNDAEAKMDVGEELVKLEVDIDGLFEMSSVENEAMALISGTACKDVIASTKCESCINTLEAYCPLESHRAINAIDSVIPRLTYPTLLFMNRFKLLYQSVEITLPFVAHEKNLFRKLIASLSDVDVVGIGCKEHRDEIACKMKKVAINICLANFIKQINGILTKKIVEPLPGQSVIHSKAFEILKKKRGIGKHGQKMIS